MLRLTREDVERFAAESGDHNPLHVCPEYARATAFGQPIAHGVLGLLMAARSLPDRPGKRLRKLAVEFPRPMLVDTDYALTIRDDGPDACALELLDGSKPVIRGVLEFADADADTGELSRGGDSGLRDAAAKPDELARGQTVSARYAPPRFGASGPWIEAGKGIGPAQVLALMLTSYVIGMELPGELALFTRLALEFDAFPSEGGELSWTARVDGWQPRTGSMRVGLELRVGGRVWATGKLRAFVRADAAGDDEPPSVVETLDARAFAGKTALVIGASRGLGRSLARGFSAHGGRVLAVSRSALEPGQFGEGSIVPLRADASDPEQLARVLAPYEQLDVLVCNASPPLQPLTLEPATATRIHAHVNEAVALVSTPLALCLPRLARARGVALLSSSHAVVDPPVEWAHYVAAKRAAEGLFEVAALQYPSVGFVVARVPRLDTAFTLNVSGEPAASTREVAQRLLERLAAPARAGVEIMSSFERG